MTPAGREKVTDGIVKVESTLLLPTKTIVDGVELDVGEGVAVAVAVVVAVLVAVADAVAVAAAVDVGVIVTVAVAVGVTVGVAVTVAVGVGVTVAVGRIVFRGQAFFPLGHPGHTKRRVGSEALAVEAVAVRVSARKTMIADL